MAKASRAANLSLEFINEFRDQLLRWFRHHKRDLPWRKEPRDPYHVWLAEIMLQQTQVATVIPYYVNWLKHFPTLYDVANASQDDILKLWQGLGYYTRARNFHSAAQIICQNMDGVIPSDTAELHKLPGIGRYTAGAIASLAFGKREPVLDGNVTRILCRVFAISSDPKSPDTVRELWTLSERLVPARHAGAFNEALMDLGSTICMPKSADCTRCPLSAFCIAYAKRRQLSYPRTRPKKAKPVRYFATAVLVNADRRILIAQRPRSGLLGGLWEFPTIEIAQRHTMHQQDLIKELTTGIRGKIGLRIKPKTIHLVGTTTHTFTHFRSIRQIAFVPSTFPAPPIASSAYIDLRWVSIQELERLPLPRDDVRILGFVSPRIAALSVDN